MTRKIIIIILLTAWTKFGFPQTDTATKLISKKGYGKVIVGVTLMQDILKQTDSKLTMTTITYLCGLANMGGECLRIARTKKFYRYKALGITYVVSSGYTISGIIFYRPFTGCTENGIIIG